MDDLQLDGALHGGSGWIRTQLPPGVLRACFPKTLPTHITRPHGRVFCCKYEREDEWNRLR